MLSLLLHLGKILGSTVASWGALFVSSPWARLSFFLCFTFFFFSYEKRKINVLKVQASKFGKSWFSKGGGIEVITGMVGRTKDMGYYYSKTYSFYPEFLQKIKVKIRSVGQFWIFRYARAQDLVQNSRTSWLFSNSRNIFLLQSCKFMQLTCEC